MRRRITRAFYIALLALVLFPASPSHAESSATDDVHAPRIEGSQIFVQRTRWAMRWIQKVGWDRYVGQNLALIMEDPASPFLGAMGLTPDGRPAAVFRSAPEDLWWYASAIVHEATHARDMAAGRKYWGREGEHAADLEQQKFLDALGSTTRVVRDPATILDGPAPTVQTLQALVEGRLNVAGK